MKKYLVLYHMSEAGMAKHKTITPEEMKAMMAGWMAWQDNCGEGLVDIGAGVGRQQVVTLAGSSEVSDDLGGYSFLQAEDLAGAKALLKDHPIFVDDEAASISLYEVKSM